MSDASLTGLFMGNLAEGVCFGRPGKAQSRGIMGFFPLETVAQLSQNRGTCGRRAEKDTSRRLTLRLTKRVSSVSLDVWCSPAAAGSCKGSFLRRQVISTNYRHNEQIRISPVRLVIGNDEQAGIVPTAEAIRMAREAGLDLVEVAPAARPPVCKIMDYGKWRYQMQKKEDRARANSKAGQLKELKFKTVKIGDNDLMVKINRARDFLTEGNKVQFTLQFRGRELAHIDLGRILLSKVKVELKDVCKVERDCKMEGKRMTLVLQPEFKSGGVKKTAGGSGAKPAPAGQRLNIPVPAGSPAAAPDVAGAPAPATAAPEPSPVAAAPEAPATPANG